MEEIGRAKEYIVKQLELEKGQSVEMGTIYAGDFMRRFCSNLCMTNQTVKAAQEAVQKSEEFDIRTTKFFMIFLASYLKENSSLQGKDPDGGVQEKVNKIKTLASSSTF
ncbi:hypothetical protein AgCh_039630 [Apium graveolens]